MLKDFFERVNKIRKEIEISKNQSNNIDEEFENSEVEGYICQLSRIGRKVGII